MIIQTNQYAEECRKIFNTACDKGEHLFKQFSAEEFYDFFFANNGYDKYFLTDVENGTVRGFSSGCYVADRNIGYITYIYVQPDFRRQGIGRNLELMTENLIKISAGDELKSIDAMFYNPMQFSWYIPGHYPHDHPCAPGVDMISQGYIFAKNVGFRDYAVQNSYYLPLSDYRIPDDISSKLTELHKRGIEITYYDPKRHNGWNEFFDLLKNEGWRKSVLAHLDRPVLVAVKDDRIIGYTGPLSVDKSGRGNFHGIGVQPDMRGGGAGKVLFCRLCEGLRDMGASFMSLYTGEENPARNIYEAAGFKIVRSWSCMRKQVRR